MTLILKSLAENCDGVHEIREILPSRLTSGGLAMRVIVDVGKEG